jgi:hypothetical protein
MILKPPILEAFFIAPYLLEVKSYPKYLSLFFERKDRLSSIKIMKSITMASEIKGT